MIVEIENPKSSCQSALDYNEGKVDLGVAELIACHNISNLERSAIYKLFETYEHSRYPVKEVSFHASINPSEDDECSEDDIVNFIADLMGALGLGEQPYLVYRHYDIERIHYHVLSVRVDADGRKINNYFEKRKASAFMADVAGQYNFHIVREGDHVQSKNSIIDDNNKSHNRLSYKPQAGNTIVQLKNIFDYALSYDFDGFSQFACILRDLGVNAEQTHGFGPDDVVLHLQGLDEKQRPCTKIMDEDSLGQPLNEKMSLASISNKQSHHIRRREKDRLSGLVSAAFKYSKSEAHFENILRNKGVGVHLSKTSSGEVFGVTFVDHLTRCVFKASEMPGVISVDMMREAVDSGHWRALDRGSSRNSYIREKRDESREAAQTLRNINEGIVTRILKPVGQPKGNSWNNKTKKTKEQLKEEFELDRSGAADVSFEDKTYDERLA